MLTQRAQRPRELFPFPATPFLCWRIHSVTWQSFRSTTVPIGTIISRQIGGPQLGFRLPTVRPRKEIFHLPLNLLPCGTEQSDETLPGLGVVDPGVQRLSPVISGEGVPACGGSMTRSCCVIYPPDLLHCEYLDRRPCGGLSAPSSWKNSRGRGGICTPFSMAAMR